MVNEPSVFELLTFDCNSMQNLLSYHLHVHIHENVLFYSVVLKQSIISIFPIVQMTVVANIYKVGGLDVGFQQFPLVKSVVNFHHIVMENQ